MASEQAIVQGEEPPRASQKTGCCKCTGFLGNNLARGMGIVSSAMIRKERRWRCQWLIS